MCVFLARRFCVGTLPITFPLFVALSLALLCPIPCPAQQPDEESAAQALLRAGEHYLDASATMQALPEFVDVIQEYPGTQAAQTARYRVAYCYAFEGRYDEAVALAREVVDANPGTALGGWAQVVIACAYAATGQNETALAEFMKVASICAGLADQSPAFEARRRIGEIGLRRGRHHHWTPARAMRLDEQNPDARAWALATAAAASAEEENLARAFAYYRELQEDYPSYVSDVAWAAAGIGEAAVKMSGKIKDVGPGDVQKVKDLLTLPRKLVPADGLLVSRAEYTLGRYLVNIERKYDTAAEILERTATDYPHTELTPLVRYELAVALRRLGRYEEAAREFKAVADGFGSSGYAAPSLYNAGLCYKELGALAEARSALMTLLQTRYEEDWRLSAQVELGRCLLLEGDLNQAADALEAAASGWLSYEDRAPVTDKGDMRDTVKAKAARLLADVDALRNRLTAQGGDAK